jgi:hypothetical protein
MRSPFPGMDPFLEKHWEDVHTRLIGYIADELQPQLADDLIARMEEKVYVEDDGDIRLRKPDVRVTGMPAPWQPSGGAGSNSTAVIDEPMLLEAFGDPLKARSVLIYDSAGNRFVTAIEILSPWNKQAGKPVEDYLDKRAKYLESGINLVEIDLIRAGNWLSMIGSYIVPKDARTTYRVTVCSPQVRGPLHYPIPIGAKLPTIKVPLRPKETPAILNLQELIERAYVMGRYNRINYGEPCSPPLEGTEKEWLAELVKNRSMES